jgi:hypothetical protein
MKGLRVLAQRLLLDQLPMNIENGKCGCFERLLIGPPERYLPFCWDRINSEFLMVPFIPYRSNGDIFAYGVCGTGITKEQTRFKTTT